MNRRPPIKTLDGRLLDRNMTIELASQCGATDRYKNAAHILAMYECAKKNGVPGSREEICMALAEIADANRDMAIALGGNPVKWLAYEFWVPEEDEDF